MLAYWFDEPNLQPSVFLTMNLMVTMIQTFSNRFVKPDKIPRLLEVFPTCCRVAAIKTALLPILGSQKQAGLEVCAAVCTRTYQSYIDYLKCSTYRRQSL